jgi:predicted phage baseplate assembly protein
VRTNLDAGVGDRPPRLDAVAKAERLVAWLRLRPAKQMTSLSLSWIGINAVEIDQRQTLTGRVVGQSNGSSDQEFQLPGQSVDPNTLELQVEEPDRGYQIWQQIDDLALADRDARRFTLDGEAGAIRFGDGVRGRIPEIGMRIRVARMRAGGGEAGNLPAGSLTKITARDQERNPVTTRLQVLQSLPTAGGENAETLDKAEKRIPALFRHRSRAVTEDDYRSLAAETPGVRVGRVELMPRFKPHQRRFDVPGVVTVMVLPFKPLGGPPSPRPDRPFLEAVHGYLDVRRALATELYVIGCEYIPLGIGIGIAIREGFDRDAVLLAVRDAMRAFLWALAPGGVDGNGWPLGRAVQDREVEVVVARVPGVASVSGIKLFEKADNAWRLIAGADRCSPTQLTLTQWQLPELLSVVVVDGDVPADLSGVPNPFGQSGIGVPVVPEVC